MPFVLFFRVAASDLLGGQKKEKEETEARLTGECPPSKTSCNTK